MVLALYIATAAALLGLTHRSVCRLSVAVAVALFAIPLALVGYALLTGGVYAPIDHPYSTPPLAELRPLYGIDAPLNASASDVYGEMLPWRRAVQASLERGEWPLWNAYMLGGHLLAANSQSAAFSPFTLLACLLPAALSFTFTAAIGFLIAAIGAYVLARDLDCGPSAALVAAIGWAFAASTVLYIHTAMGATSVFEPLLFVAAGRMARKPSLSAAALLTIVLALMILAGHPETLFLAVVAASAFAVFELVRARRAPWRAIGFAAAAGVVALLLTAIHLMPFLDGLSQSAELEVKRKYWSPEPRSLPNERVLAVMAGELFPYLHVRYWVDPAFGYMPAETAACGSICLALAIYAAWRRRSSSTWFLLGMAIVCLAVLSRWHPVIVAVQKLPLMDITHHERFAFTAALALVMLAALGVEELMRRRDAVACALALLAVLIVLGFGTQWIQRHVVLAEMPADFGRYETFAELFFLAIAILTIVFVRSPKIIGPALVMLLVAQRAVAEHDTFRTFDASAAYPPVPILKPLESVPRPFRIVGQHYAFLPATGTFYGLEDVRGWEALTFAPFVHTWSMWCHFQVVWFNRVDDLSTPFLSLLNVRYAIASRSEAPPAGWREVARQREAVLLENTKVLPRAFVPRRVVVGKTMEQQIEAMQAERDFGERAWITAAVSPFERENGPGRVTIREYSPGGTYLLDVEMDGDGWIVLSDNAWNGWRAYIDGKRLEMQKANAAFNSVFVPRGRHKVRIVYWPVSFVRGRAISFLTIAAIVVVVGVRSLRKRKSIQQ